MFKALSFRIAQLLLCTVGCFYAGTTQAQISTDGTVNTQVNQNGNTAEITGGETRGANLFHSFQEFSLQTGNEAFFDNTDSINNIFSRVTGGSISNIDGLIRANGSASLFLINPAGIVFGENARLDIGGSFYGSSASSILFEDGEFSAVDNLQQPVLTINAPIGLNFRDNPGDITNRSAVDDVGLSVNQGQNISLLGGNVSVENGAIVFAPGGSIHLGGLLAAGTVNFTADNNLSFPENVVRGDVSLRDSSIVAVISDGGGSIEINAANLAITNGGQLLGGIAVGSGSSDAQAGNIVINATESVAIDGQNNSDVTTGIFGRVGSNSRGNAGNVDITTTTFTLKDRGSIDVSSSGQGNGGNVTINADNSITLEGSDPTAASSTAVNTSVIGDNAQGNAGNIGLTTGSLSLNNGTSLLAANFADGQAGNVTINAAGNVSFANNAEIFVTGASGGSIELNAQNLSITSGSSFFAGIVGGNSPEAQAGNITLNLQEDLILDGLDSTDITFIANNSFGIGNPGDIIINAKNITFQNGGSITSFAETQETIRIGDITLNATENIIFDSTKSFEISGILNNLPEDSTGSIGQIDITAQNLTLTNGAAISSLVAGTGDSGNINLDVADSIRVDGFGDVVTQNSAGTVASTISSNIFRSGVGNAGTININTQNLILARNGSISSELLGQGNGGNINIDAELITIGEQGSSDISPSYISTESFGEGNGGNITIDTGSLSISDGADINVGVSGVGNGGSIKINAREFVTVDGTGTLSDSQVISGILADIFATPSGNAGNIEINTANLTVTNGAFVSADVFGGSSGNGGNINIQATESIEASGGGGIRATIFEGSIGDGGNLTIETKNLTVRDDSQIAASTLGEGNAGNLTITATESINLSGANEAETFRSGLFAKALIGDGNGGNLTIETGELNIDDGATIEVGNFPSFAESPTPPGTGEPGTIKIQADSVNLSNEGSIVATTQAVTGEGANITLQVADNITLRNGGLISAEAFNRGNGGNINIDTNFIVAFPNSNSDIIANAQRGNGGNIDINAESLFGIEERSLNNFTNDINASSAFSLDGNITISTPGINPVQGATELPQNIVTPETTIAQACETNRELATKNQLTIMGKGGVPAAPDLPLDSRNILINGVDGNTLSTTPSPIETAQGKIQPARGVKVTQSGEIILTAYPTENTSDRLPTPRRCG